VNGERESVTEVIISVSFSAALAKTERENRLMRRIFTPDVLNMGHVALSNRLAM
jgi:hypothetical protein